MEIACIGLGDGTMKRPSGIYFRIISNQYLIEQSLKLSAPPFEFFFSANDLKMQLQHFSYQRKYHHDFVLSRIVSF